MCSITFWFQSYGSSPHSLECERRLCVISFLQSKICKKVDLVSILDRALTSDEHGIVVQRDGPSPQEVNLMTRSKEGALLIDERKSFRMIAVVVCVRLFEVSKSMFL